MLGLIIIIAGCAQPPEGLDSPTSRAAFANPNCWQRCYVTVSSVDDNAPQGALTTTETRSGTVTETETGRLP